MKDSLAEFGLDRRVAISECGFPILAVISGTLITVQMEVRSPIMPIR